jgi:hypothetical protein
MDTIVTTLSPGDIFLIETPTGTQVISAVDINYLSLQFEKVLNRVRVLNLVTNETKVEILSALSFRLINNTNTITTSGVFNSYTFTNGVVTSAYNIYDSQTAGLSSATDTAFNNISAGVFSVFFDSGSAVLDYSLWYPGGGSGGGTGLGQIIVGTKTVPTGVTIGAEDIQMKLLYNNSMGEAIANSNTVFQISTAYPIAYIRDKDYELEYFDDEVPDFDNNYVSSGKIRFAVSVINNIIYPPEGRVILSWSVNKFY